MALDALPATLAELELRCPRCKSLVFTYHVGRWGDIVVTIRTRCRRCKAMFSADLHPDRAVASLTAT
jgi:phage FluMu protein Com